jgi:hypothetical protein
MMTMQPGAPAELGEVRVALENKRQRPNQVVIYGCRVSIPVNGPSSRFATTALALT